MTLHRTSAMKRREIETMFRAGFANVEISAALKLPIREVRQAVRLSNVWRGYTALLAAGNEFAARARLRRIARGVRFQNDHQPQGAQT